MRIWLPVLTLALHAGVFAQAPSEAPAPAAKPPETIPLAHVEVRGTGRTPVILIPGLACDWSVFDSFMTRNAERYRMYAVTLPGFGGSAPPPPPPADNPLGDAPWLANAERALVEFIQRRGIRKPIIIGHSMGGHLALRIGLHHPDLVKSVVSIDGFPVYPTGGMGQEVPRDDREARAEALFAGLASMEPQTWKSQQTLWIKGMVSDEKRGEELAGMVVSVPQLTTCRYMAELMASDLSGKLAGLAVPALLLAAIPEGGLYGHSTDQIEAMWKGWASRSERISLAVIRGSKHFVMVDAPADLDRAIEQWAKGEPVEGTARPGE